MESQALSPGLERTRTILRWLLGAAYLVAGIAHLRSPDPFVRITPEWVPFPEVVIAATGIAEILGAIALLFLPRLRRVVGTCLALYAVCVFPANINHAMSDIAIGGRSLTWWYHGPRLAFQPVIVWWALFAGGLINWPWRGRAPFTQGN